MKPVEIKISGEITRLSSALIGGFDGDVPMAMYSGSLDFDDILNALYYSNRAVIKLLTEEFRIPLREVDDYLLAAVSGALQNELNHEGEWDVRKTYHKNSNDYGIFDF